MVIFPWRAQVCALLALALGLSPVVAQTEEPLSKGYADFPRVAATISADSAVQLALEHSLAVALGRIQLRLQSSETEEARAASRPQLSLNGFAMRNSMSMISQSAPGTMPNFIQSYNSPGAVSASAMFMMPLFTGGALEHQLQAAEQSERAAVARTAFSLRETARQVRLAYFQVQESRAKSLVLAWQLTQNLEVERIAQEQLRAGKVAPFVKLRAQAEVAATQQGQNDLRAEVSEREVALKVAMGVAMDSNFGYPTQEAPPANPAPLSDLMATSLQERSDLVAARFAVDQGDQLVSAAISEYAPKSYLVAMGERTRTNPFGASMSETGYSIGVVFSFPLYDGGLRAAREDRARASLDERRLQLRQLELQATGQVAAARARLLSSLDNLELSQVELNRAQEDWRIAQLRMVAGRAIYLEVLDALLAISRARNNQVRALFSARTADAELMYAIGRY